jgi:hypothetical protein
MIINTKIKIISSNKSWTQFKYLFSNSKSRIKTSELVRKLKNGTVEIVNPIALNMSNKLDHYKIATP